MLRKTFRHLPGIGPETEARLWESGIDDWQKLFDEIDSAPIGTADSKQIAELMYYHLQAIQTEDWNQIQAWIGLPLAWRAFREMESRCLYLDIETNGGNQGSDITIIGLYDGEEFKALVHGKDLDEFESYVEKASMFVTFFGSGFDIPMLKKRFNPQAFNKLHLDLCPTLRGLGYKGGLKKIEVQLGLERVEETQGLSGFDAVKLWGRYANLGDDSALDLLVAYNREDVVNLQWLARFAVDRLESELQAPITVQ